MGLGPWTEKGRFKKRRKIILVKGWCCCSEHAQSCSWLLTSQARGEWVPCWNPTSLSKTDPVAMCLCACMYAVQSALYMTCFMSECPHHFLLPCETASPSTYLLHLYSFLLLTFPSPPPSFSSSYYTHNFLSLWFSKERVLLAPVLGPKQMVCCH